MHEMLVFKAGMFASATEKRKTETRFTAAKGFGSQKQPAADRQPKGCFPMANTIPDQKGALKLHSPNRGIP
jgi:hypothetical protein